VIGESSSLFMDLLIFERDYLGKMEAREFFEELQGEFFSEGNKQEQIISDIGRVVRKINLNSCWILFRKWNYLIEEKGTGEGKEMWQDLQIFLKK
jgi:hypothetical protein